MMYIVHIIGLDRNTMSVNQLYTYIFKWCGVGNINDLFYYLIK